MKRKKRKAGRDVLPSVISSHLSGIKRALLEGDKRSVFLDFLERVAARTGIYALYDKRGRLYYAGRASDLSQRLNQHLRDRHGESWDLMTLFVVSDGANVPELEGLVAATAKPPGNTQRPKIGTDLRKALKRHLKEDALLQIDQAIYPERKRKQDKLSRRITTKKLHSISQKRLAGVLGISQPRVSHLFRDKQIRRYIRESGKRDAVRLGSTFPRGGALSRRDTDRPFCGLQWDSEGR